MLRGKISGEKFESQKWKTANMNSEENWSLRWDMMNDLRNDYQLIGMSKNEIIKLLGEPENYSDLEENTIAYGIMEDYGWNIDPVETKTLRIELTKDSLVSGYKIIHWKN